MLTDQESSFNQSLQALFYRDSCPNGDVLGEYYADELASGDRLVVAQHLRLCPHCRAELSLYGQGCMDIVPDESLIQRVVSSVRWALERSDLQPALVRGTPYKQYLYTVDDMEIRLEIAPAASGYQRLRLFGQIKASTPIDKVELWDEKQAQCELFVPVHEGYFEFAQLADGEYLLCLKSSGTETWVGPLSVRHHTGS
ncbi:hypothetical protein KFU94_05130 [Chloroflexi bacterium TSY]|nr:hypothetical protein [Chloroflexi bacterium TSY]